MKVETPLLGKETLKHAGRIAVLAALMVSGALASEKPSHPAAKPAKKHKVAQPSLYEIGYSHLDTQWCWSYPQVIREFIPNTLHENFALFKKYPNYVFNWTGSNRYRFMKEYYPADYAQLKKYVAMGKWFPAGSSVEEGDVNSPSEESLIRQVMYGNEFFHKEFGIQSNEYMLPDCFGFPASLPSILAHCGLKGFSTQKLTWGSAVGIPFNVGKWVGPDGHSIVSALNPGAYDSDVKTDLATDPDWIARLQRDATKDGVAVDYSYYGVGDRGGAPNEDSVKLVQEAIKQSGPIHVYSGRADQMFNDLTPSDIEKLPSYKGDLELTEHSAGSLTSEGAIKRWNRKNELLANEAESASVAANWLGAAKYDKPKITDAWLRFLPGQFHDLMAGTALPVAYNYTWNDEILAMNEFADVLQNSVGGVSRSLNTQRKGVPITVYNPLSIDREDVVEASIHFPGPAPAKVQVYDAFGPVPTQVLSRSGQEAKIVFDAKVPSLGFAVFDARPVTEPELAGMLRITKSELENSRYLMKISPGGDVSSVYDKLNKKELLEAPSRLVYMHENPGQFPAWNMDWTDQKQRPRAVVSGSPTVEIVEDGPVRVALRITRRHEGSKYVQTLRLGSGDSADRLDFVTQIDWQGKESALKAVFPLTVSNPNATYNWGLGTVSRDNNNPKRYEVASHGWIDLTNKDSSYGVSVLDDCKYGSDKPNDNTLRLTLIYTPGTKGGYQHQGTQDWGRNRMTYSLMGHTGGWAHSRTQWESAELNQPLLAFQTAPHPGASGTSLSLAHVSDPNISVEALKQAEGSDETVVRLNELSGESHSGVDLKFAAPIESAREIDGQERTIAPVKIKSGSLKLDMKPYEPRAFAIRLGKPHSSLSAPTSTPLALPYNLTGISSGFGAHDADFDGKGASIPGDLVPERVTTDGVDFKIGPKGKQDVLVPDGQTIKLPAGQHRKIYILGASVGRDSDLSLNFGGEVRRAPLQRWDGFIGQWDSRDWGGEVPELAYDWHNPLTGETPGYIKRQPVAWYADHKRTADGGNDIYAFCYLFKGVVEIPDGATHLTLSKNSDARIVAMSVASNPNLDSVPAQPLYDELDHSGSDGPLIQVSEPTPHAEKLVTLQHPLYWSAGSKLHYTLDGTAPSLQSPVYVRPFAVGATSALTVASLGASGATESVSKRSLNVDDTIPPSVISATRQPIDPSTNQIVLKVEFSEEVAPKSAENPANYWTNVGTTFVAVSSAKLAEDGRTVLVSYPVNPLNFTSLKVRGVEDVGGVACAVSVPIRELTPVFSAAKSLDLTGVGDGMSDPGSGNLPLAGSTPWTLNFFVKMDKAPEDLTLLAGFGNAQDESGAQRYLIANKGHIYFWGSNIDIDSGVDYDLGRWQMISATYDGKTVRLFKDGKEIKKDDAELNDAESVVRFGPPPPWDYGHKFKGSLANVTIWTEALPPSVLAGMTGTGPK